MQQRLENLKTQLETQFSEHIKECQIAFDELTIEVRPDQLIGLAKQLRDHANFRMDMLMDVCVVDYLHYGLSEWETYSATETGFSRGVEKRDPTLPAASWNKPRFAVVYHLLSTEFNHRLRIKVFPEGEPPIVPTVNHIWPSANWFEREAFDLFGVFFDGHPDLRRILTDYGFTGHPFRKDFPLIGEVEMRYDAELGRVVYEPVSIEARIGTPKVLRDDNRYTEDNNHA